MTEEILSEHLRPFVHVFFIIFLTSIGTTVVTPLFLAVGPLDPWAFQLVALGPVGSPGARVSRPRPVQNAMHCTILLCWYCLFNVTYINYSVIVHISMFIPRSPGILFFVFTRRDCWIFDALSHYLKAWFGIPVREFRRCLFRWRHTGAVPPPASFYRNRQMHIVDVDVIIQNTRHCIHTIPNFRRRIHKFRM